MMKAKMFEKSKKDVERKNVKEGSKKDMAMDKKEMKAMKLESEKLIHIFQTLKDYKKLEMID